MRKYDALIKSPYKLAWRWWSRNCNPIKMYYDGVKCYKYHGDDIIIFNPADYEGYTDWEPVNV